MRLCAIVAVLGLFLYGCSCNSSDNENLPSQSEIEAELLQMNLQKQKEENDSIVHYIQKKGWNMITLKNGIRYQMIEAGRGDSIHNGDVVTVAFKVYLLNDKLCYESTPADPVSFKVGEDHIESGLHELVPLLRKGDRVRVILPSVLAFGFSGDKNKIPGDSPLYYELFILYR